MLKNICSECAKRFNTKENHEFDESKKCQYCNNILPQIISKIKKFLADLDEIEFTTFSMGVSLSNKILRTEDRLLRKGAVKTTLRSYIDNIISAELVSRGKKQTNNLPDVSIEINDSNELLIGYSVRPVYILGRYRKLSREIPQTKWPCSKCKGVKCEECDYTGLQYKLSVEGIIASPFLKIVSSFHSSFHGAGREDIDALMLGKGRPFVLELKIPKRRVFDFQEAINEINKSGLVEVANLRYCEKAIISRLKQGSSTSDKIYKAIVQCSSEIDLSGVSSLENLDYPIILSQRTPLRVLHRRVDMIRNKKIYEIRILQNIKNNFHIEIRAEGGAYIKEFISGDNGRTNPSISSILGIQCACIELNVISVDDKGLF